jgi:hypothetical protein
MYFNHLKAGRKRDIKKKNNRNSGGGGDLQFTARKVTGLYPLVLLMEVGWCGAVKKVR